MMNNNKILTVSYGTFSCALEGFDDSFGTMKVIAEYFRDLAADDRYFGAEPPQPDAQMLARLAQREVSRRVVARQDEGRIVLSAREMSQIPDLGERDLPGHDSSEHDLPERDRVARDVVEDVAVAVADATQAQIGLQAQTGLQSQTGLIGVNGAGPDNRTDTALNQGTSADAPAQAAAAPQPPKATPVDIVPSLPDAEVEAFFAASAAQHGSGTLEEEPQDETAQERSRADSIADKLKRIRAVVSQQGAEAAKSDYSEDQHATPTAPPPAPAASVAVAAADKVEAVVTPATDSVVMAQSPSDPVDTTAADAAAEDHAARSQSTADESEDDDVGAILSRLEVEAGDTRPSERADYAEEDEANFEDEISAGPQSRSDGALEDDLDTDGDDGTAEDLEHDITVSMEEDIFGEDENAATSDVDGSGPAAQADDRKGADTRADGANVADAADAAENLFDEPDDAELLSPAPATGQEQAAVAQAPAASRTRVLKVRRSALEAAVRSGQLEEYDDEDAPQDVAHQPQNQPQTQPQIQPLRRAPLADSSTLSDAQERDLARELADLEAEMVAGPPPATRGEAKGSAEDDFSRLMDESDQQMDEPESVTRRDAFAHLRAAVAATKADEAVGGTAPHGSSDEAYRDDLATVVRPRRPESGERPRTERPPEQRPAPLKLVAEQRIDLGQPRTMTPVRPRRVAAVAAAPQAQQDMPDASNFTELAAQMGAHKLPDLLEAAAAYLSFVEGHAQFSRPQLMTKVRQVERENFTREDSLRSFGKLLREGKIEKLEGGRFQASEQIGFKPDARAAG